MLEDMIEHRVLVFRWIQIPVWDSDGAGFPDFPISGFFWRGVGGYS
jgi:hypothetical protein